MKIFAREDYWMDVMMEVIGTNYIQHVDCGTWFVTRLIIFFSGDLLAINKDSLPLIAGCCSLFPIWIESIGCIEPRSTDTSVMAEIKYRRAKSFLKCIDDNAIWYRLFNIGNAADTNDCIQWFQQMNNLVDGGALGATPKGNERVSFRTVTHNKRPKRTRISLPALRFRRRAGDYTLWWLSTGNTGHVATSVTLINSTLLDQWQLSCLVHGAALLFQT